MQYRFIHGLLLLALSTSVTAQNNSENAVPDANIVAAQPKINFTNTSHDFGQVFQGQKMTISFNFVNSGEGPLVIHGVHAGCGCTAVEVEKGRPYQPGEKGSVNITFDSANFAGPVTKIITVMTNQKLTPDRTLTIRANVVQEIGATPPLVDFGDLLVGETKDATVIIKSTNRQNLTVGTLRYNKDRITAAIEPRSAFEWKLKVTIKPQTQAQFVKETIYIANSSNHLKELPIPVRANIKNGVETVPSYIEFGAVARGEKIRRTVTISGVDPEKIKASETTLHVNGEKVKDFANFVVIDKGTGTNKSEIKFTIELKNQTTQPGNVHGRLLFKSDDTKTGEVPVDFYAFFR